MPTTAPPRSSPKKPFVIAAILVVLLAGVGATIARSALSARGPQAAVRSLSKAVHDRDAEGAMRWIDFDAVFEEAWRSSVAQITGKEPTAQEIASALANPTVTKTKETFRKNISVYVADPTRAGGDGGAFFSALNTLDSGEVSQSGRDRATVKLPNDYSLQLARRGGDWKVVAFHGYEKDMDAYRKKADQLMKDRGLKPASNDDVAAQGAANPAP